MGEDCVGYPVDPWCLVCVETLGLAGYLYVCDFFKVDCDLWVLVIWINPMTIWWRIEEDLM